MGIALLLSIVTVLMIELKGQCEQIANASISSTRAKRQVLKDRLNDRVIWKNGVFYTFNTTDQETRKAFEMGMKMWTDNTCIDFIESRNAADKVIIQDEAECHSRTGRVGGDQPLCLNEKTEGAAAHAIGHVLGFFHTVQRYDRDSFIKIESTNVKPSFMKEFEIVSMENADVYGLTYDYGSVMHHSELSGTVNGQLTIVSKDGFYQKTMGSPIISFSDFFVINRRYGCDAKCNKTTSANCTNHGFPHPRYCTVCICPSGYGGALCDKRPPGCGKTLEATQQRKTLTHRIGYGFGLRDQFNFCNFVITAPQEKEIEVDLLSISLGYDNPGCKLGGVEIKAQVDQRRTGYRFCSVTGSGGPIFSSSNRLPIILYNRFTFMDVNLTYRYIN